MSSSGASSIFFRILLVIFAALIVAAFWQLVLALQTLRAVSTPHGSTAFLARRTILPLSGLPLFRSLSAKSTTTKSSSSLVGQRVVLNSLQPGAKLRKEILAAQYQHRSWAAAQHCDPATSFAFAPSTLAMWCAAQPASDDAAGHSIVLSRLDAATAFLDESSSSSAPLSKFTSGARVNSVTPIAAPFLVNVPPEAGAIEVADVLEDGAVSVVLLRERNFGSIYSSICSLSSSSPPANVASCGPATLMVDGNTSTASGTATECVVRSLASSSFTSTAASELRLVASCNVKNSTSTSASSFFFFATLATASRTFTQSWTRGQMSGLGSGVLRYVSPVFSVPSTFPAAPSSSSDGLPFAYIHVALVVGFNLPSSSSSSSSTRVLTAALVDLTSTAAKADFSTTISLVPQSQTDLPAAICTRRDAAAGDGDDDDDDECICCSGWVLDPHVRSAPKSVARTNESVESGFISFLHVHASSSSVLHIAATFRNFFVTADRSRRQATLTAKPLAFHGGWSGVGAAPTSSVAQSWTATAAQRSAIVFSTGGDSPSGPSLTLLQKEGEFFAMAIQNGTNAEPVRMGLAGGQSFRCPQQSRNAALGLFANKTLFQRNSVLLGCGDSNFVTLLASDGGSWQEDSSNPVFAATVSSSSDSISSSSSSSSLQTDKNKIITAETVAGNF